MAITWELTITPQNVAAKTASVTAIRTDDVSGDVETHSIDTVILSTGAQKTAALNQLWQQHLDHTTEQTAIAAFIGTMEADGKSNLEARE